MYYEDSLDPGPEMPTDVPAKFRDPATGGIRTDALLRAYLELEKRQNGMVRVPAANSSAEELAAFRRALGVPDSPDGYCIECRHELLTADAEVNRRLHEAGFTPRQAQLVYDLAHERVVPMLDRMREEFAAEQSLNKLKDYFGGDARWGETARQVSAWGKANLSPEVYAALASNAEGIIAMQKMMASGEPAMGRTRGGADEPVTEEGLKKMMADPRYWKKRDPAWIAKVQEGFTRLYGED
ncbi:MAG: hypothetical protein AB1918_04390 [Pseudomonadota bacterium]